MDVLLGFTVSDGVVKYARKFSDDEPPFTLSALDAQEFRRLVTGKPLKQIRCLS